MNFTGAYGTGERTSASLQFRDGYRADAVFNYDANGNELNYRETIIAPNGAAVWAGSFNPNGGYIRGTGTGGYGAYGYFGGGGYDFAASSKAPAGTDIGFIASFDLDVAHDADAANAAEAARQQASEMAQAATAAPGAGGRSRSYRAPSGPTRSSPGALPPVPARNRRPSADTSARITPRWSNRRSRPGPVLPA